MRVRLWVTAFSSFLFCGCFVSRTHIGFHNFGQGDLWDSVVGKKYVEGLRDKEDMWMARVARLQLDELSADFAPQLAAKLIPAVTVKLIPQLKRDYGPTGYFTRRRFGTPALSVGHAVRMDAFDYYDMVAYAYEMEGKTAGYVQFYITRVDGQLKICGLEITPTRESDREKAKDVRFVFPETVDKSHVARHLGMLMRPRNN